MSTSVSFDPSCAISVGPNTVNTLVEAYCLSSGTTIKDFPLSEAVSISALAGTLSFFPLNWPWYKTGNIAICGVIGAPLDVLYTFDFQSHNRQAINIPIYASFAKPIRLETLRFNLYPDLTLPTDFRAALVFYRAD